MAIAGTQPPNAADVHVTAARLKAVFDDPEFPNLTEVERQAANLVYGAALFDLRDYQSAQSYLKTATQMPGAELLDWDLRMRDSYALKDYSDAASATAVIARHWPEGLGKYRDEAIFTMLRAIQNGPGRDTDALALLQALRMADWKPSDPFRNSDPIWFSLTRIDADRGDIAGARDAAAQIRNPLMLVELHADRRFDRVMRGARFDVARAVDAYIASVRVLVAAYPAKLAGANTLAEALLNAGRPAEALQVLDAALARLKADPKAFDDADKLNWTLDDRASALLELGRSDEGIAAMALAAAKPEDGEPNTSQSINLADVYLLYDRPRDALAAIAQLDSSGVSAYGAQALDDARACALVELNDPVRLAVVLDRMKAHAASGAQPYLDALLFAGRQDEAAAFFIAELDDPVSRPEMLLHFQDFAIDPHATRRALDLHAAVLALRARPDVAAAIKRVGRIQSYPSLMPGYD